MALPTPANTTCQIYRAGLSPAPVWQDPCTDTDGTFITAHAPALPTTGVYLYCDDNTGGIVVESDTLQGTFDGGDNRFFFDPGLPDPSVASIDFKFTNSGMFPAADYYLRLGVRYGNDAGGGDGYLALLSYGGSTWILSLNLFEDGTGSLMNSVNLTLSPDIWYTLQAGTDGAGNVWAAVLGQGTTSAPTDGLYASNTQVMFSTSATNEMAFRNIVVTAGSIGPVPCILASDWRLGQDNGDRRVNAIAWTDFMLVDASIDVRDGYTGASTFTAQDTVYIPDATGTPFTVIFVELWQRGPAQYKRVYLDRGLPNWPTDSG
jgi:hypothetical protein